MSNHFAIATATAALRLRVIEAVDGMGVTVKIGRPTTPTGTSATARLVWVYLYQVTPNKAWRNADLPTRRADGSSAQRAVVALDLHYLICFPGDDEFEPQVLLGMVTRKLHAEPVFKSEFVRSVSQGPLAASNLADSIEPVRVVPSVLTLEEVSKLWAVLQSPYILSVAYLASVVLIEEETDVSSPLPVRKSNVLEAQPVITGPTAVQGYALPISVPSIQKVLFRAPTAVPPPSPVTEGPVLWDSTWEIVLVGTGLFGDGVGVRFDGDDTLYAPTSVTPTELVVPLSSAPRAGARSVQVVHQTRFSTSSTLHSGTTSAAAVFVIRPVATLAKRVETVTAPTGTFLDATNIVPPVGVDQRVLVLFNEVNATPGSRPRSFAIEAPRVIAQTSSLSIMLSGIAAGTYLVRLMVDGAETPLTFDASGAYDGPQVTLP